MRMDHFPSILRTRAWSAGATTMLEPFRRFELRLSAIMPCRRFEARRIALPVPESLKRFRAARFDFILGIPCSFPSVRQRRRVRGAFVVARLRRGLGAALLGFRGEHERYRAAFRAGR